mgnify:CR=1 FL=1|tara:strand:+ start:3325 stop:4872 length:1548 start_codon:yes stop_codon:yes gene_type:complete
MKKILIILFIIVTSGCATQNDVSKEEKKKCGIAESAEKCKARIKNPKDFDNLSTIDIAKVKNDRKKVIELTADEGPSTGFSNKKQPRKALSANRAELKSNTKLSGPTELITINFNNVNLSEGLVALGRLVNRNVIVSQEVNGYLNFQIYKQPWNDVFNSILEMNKLSFIGGEQNNILRVYTLKENMTEGSSESSSNLETEVFNIFYNKPSDLVIQMTPLFSGSGEGEDEIKAATFVADDLNKTIVVQGVKNQINRIEEILNTIDVKKAQILIEAFIVEVSPTFERKLGSRLGIAQNRPNSGTEESKIVRGIAGTQLTTPTDTLTPGTDENSVTSFLVGGTSGLGIIARTSTQQLKIEIDALETQGESKTLSNPKIFTVSGKNAKITQGTNLVVSEQVNADGVVTTTNKFIPVTLELDVTPTITGDGTIELLLKIKNDSITDRATAVVSNNEVNTSLLIADGEIAVIGGILTEAKTEAISRVPLLGKIPIVGALFRSKAETNKRTELLIFIAPRII